MMEGVNVFRTPQLTFFDLGKRFDLINSFKRAGAICKHENNHFYYYLPNGKMQYVEKVYDEHTFKGILYPYQKEDLQRLINLNRVILAHSTGLGKTVMAIAGMNYLHTLPHNNKSLVLISSDVMLDQWKTAFTQFSDLRVAAYGEKGFDEADVQLVLYSRLSSKSYSTDYYYYIVVLDEANMVKNGKAQRTKKAYSINANYKWLLTATPIRNNPLEVYSYFRVMDVSQITFRSYIAFRDEYAIMAQMPYSAVPVPIGVKNVEKLKAQLYSYCIYRNKLDAEVAAQLGARLDYITDIQYIPLTPLQSRLLHVLDAYINNEINADAYDYLDGDNMDSEYMRKRNNLLPFFSLSRLLADSTGLLSHSSNKLIPLAFNTQDIYDAEHVKESNKLNVIKENLERMDGKTVIWTHYTAMAKEIYLMLQNDADMQHEMNPLIATNEQKDIVSIVKSFMNDDKYNVLISTDKLEYGVDLYKAQNLILVDLPFTYSQLEQIIGRLVRRGQTHTPNVVYLIGRGSIDERILDILNKKTSYNKFVRNDNHV